MRKWIGKGIVWFFKHPEVLQAFVDVVNASKAARDAKK